MSKARHYPEMPPLFDGEDSDHYSNRLIGVYGKDAYPYDHVRNRQCSLGWHSECSEREIPDPGERRCQCPCHEPSPMVQSPVPSLLDLRDRLVRAAGSVDDLRNKAAALHNLTEHARLAGKLEGVRLALSYLDETIGR
jgi:hypothetical protein